MNISIIVTTYNAEKYVLAALKSVMAQTYQQFEIIVVDDGSTDATVKKIEEYSLQIKTNKIKFYSLTHIGRSAALNYAIEKTNFHWVAIIDADDLWNVHKLAIQVQCIKENNLDFIASQSNNIYDDEQVDLTQFPKNDVPLMEVSLNKMLYMNFIAHSSVLAKKKLLKYNRKRKTQIDYEMWLRLLNSGNKIYLQQQYLIFHRIHSKQSFEGRHRIRYALGATFLQIKYCLLKFKIIPLSFVLVKFIYYLFLPRKLRFFLRNLILEKLTMRRKDNCF